MSSYYLVVRPDISSSCYGFYRYVLSISGALIFLIVTFKEQKFNFEQELLSSFFLFLFFAFVS